MAWKSLESISAWDSILSASHRRPQLVYKHSTRCGICHGVLARLKDSSTDLEAQMDLHYLDLLSHRDVSNQIAADTHVIHESPQVIVLDKGRPVYHMSQGMISPARILASVK